MAAHKRIMQELQKRTSTSISAESEQRMPIRIQVSDSTLSQCHTASLSSRSATPVLPCSLPCE